MQQPWWLRLLPMPLLHILIPEGLGNITHCGMLYLSTLRQERNDDLQPTVVCSALGLLMHSVVWCPAYIVAAIHVRVRTLPWDLCNQW